MTELGVGYISIVPEVSKITPGISKALTGAEPVVEKSGKSMGGRIAAGIGTTLKASVAGVGLAAGGVLAGAVTKGLGRLTGIENAQASLRGLGHDAASVDAIMTNALASVKGTAYGLDSAASVAASAVAAGVRPGQDLERTLKLVGDAAAIAKTDLSSMGSIVNKVATSDMMQMDVANQLMDAGIPILQMVASEMGVTAEEARKMASKGQVSFETFQTALEQGVGGAALEAGNTFQGAAANMGAALGRLGATGLTPFFDLAKDGMGVATRAIDGLNSAIVPMAQGVGTWLQGTAVPAVKDFGAELQNLGQNTNVQAALSGAKSAFVQIVDAGRALAPVVVDVATSLGQAGASIGVAAWSAFVATLEAAAGVLEMAAGPLSVISGFLRDHPTLVTAAVAAWAGAKTIPDVIGKVSGALAPLGKRLAETRQGGLDVQAMFEAQGHSIGRFDAQVRHLAYGGGSLGEMARAYGNAAEQGGAFARAQGLAAAGLQGVKGAASNLMGVLGGPWGVALMAAGAVVAANAQATARLESAQENMASSAREAATAQLELQAAVAGTSGTLNETALGHAATVVKGELAEMMELGEAYSGFIRKVETDTTVWERMWNIGGQWEADKAKAAAIGEEFKALEAAAEDLNISLDDVHTIVAEGGPQYAALLEHLRGSGEAGGRAAEGLESARSEMGQMVADARRLDPAVADAAAAIDILADSSSTADEKLGALHRMLQAMGLAPKDAEVAMRDAAEAVDEIVEAASNTQLPLENMGQSLIDAAEAGDWTHEGWRDLSRTLEGMGKELQNVATNGGDVAGTYETQQAALDALAAQYDISREKLDELARASGLVPDEISMGVILDGADETTKRLGEVWTQKERLAEGATVEVSALTDEAKEALEEAGYAVEKIEGSKNVAVTAETDDAKDNLETVIRQMADLGDMEVEPAVLLNTDALEGSAGRARQILDALAIENPTPQADLIIQRLLEGVDISQGELDFLASQTSRPAADLNRDLLEAGVKVSNEMLDALQSRPTVSVLDADGKPLSAAVRAAQGDLDSLQDKQVTITTVHHRIDYWTQQGVAPEMAQQIQGPVPLAARGLRIPALAGGGNTGYRLPLTGPGTETVDGFLGLDDQLMPVARVNRGEWVVNGDSSRLYDRALALINRNDPSIQHLQRLEDGGRAGATPAELLAYARGERVNGQQASRSLEGAPYVFGGHNWGDCSSAQGQLALFAKGMPADRGRYMSTMDEATQLAKLGFRSGLNMSPGVFNIGWLNGGPGGGHTSSTIDGVNLEMGGSRGNGQIGGGAAPASHPQYTHHAHLPLGQGMRSETTTTVYGTSVNGYTTNRGTVGFGEAQSFYDTALDYLTRRPVQIFDTGGILPTGGLALNLGAPERVLSPAQTRAFERALVVLPTSATEMSTAARLMVEAATMDIESARAGVQDWGRGLGGDWLGQVKIVRDAEQGLINLRKQIAEEADGVAEAEERLSEARQRVKDLESEGVEASVSNRRKIEDAEAALAKARKDGKADRVADAEKRLARAREDVARDLEKQEDKRAKDMKKALADVEKAEEKLADARQGNTDVALRLEAAERAIAAARIQAVADMTTDITTALAGMAASVSKFAMDMATMSAMAEATRQKASAEQQALARHQIAVLQAQNALRLAEWDVVMARQQGVDSLTRAERGLSGARDASLKIGGTSVNDLATAVDRFRVDGVWAADEWKRASSGMAAATAGYAASAGATLQASEERKALLQSEMHLRELEALHLQEMAGLAAAEATLLQAQSAEMLRLHTAHLEEQTKALYGMQPENATGLGGFLGGLSKLFSGGGGIVSGILTGLAGFATGGPVGAIPGALMALKGIPDAVRGIADMWHNRHEARAGWDEMDLEAKIVTGLGVLGAATSTGLGLAGAQQYGPEAVVGGIQVGEQFLTSTLQSLSGVSESKMQAAENRHSAEVAALQAKIDAQRADNALAQAEKNAHWEIAKEAAQADVEWHELQVAIKQAADARTREQLQEKADLVAARRDELRELAESTAAALAEIKPTGEVVLVGEGFSAQQVEDLINRHVNEVYGLDLRVTRLEKDKQPTATQYAAARR